MQRAFVASLAFSLLVLGIAAAVWLTSASRERSANLAPPASSPRLATKIPPDPPLEGRIQLNEDQVRQAYAAGLIDRPIRTLLSVPSHLTYGDFVWNDRGVPTGPVWVRVDLSSQIISVFRSGHEIGTAVVLYGTDGLPTPTGRFPILAKLKDHRSATYGDAPMPYTLRLTPDGVSIHGSNVRWGFATHGCIGVPKEFAAKLFDVVHRGDDVLIVSGKGTSAPA